MLGGRGMRLKVLKGECGEGNEQILGEILIVSAVWQIPGSENKLYNFVCGCPGFQLSNLPCCWPNIKARGLAANQRFRAIFYGFHPHPLPSPSR